MGLTKFPVHHFIMKLPNYSDEAVRTSKLCRHDLENCPVDRVKSFLKIEENGIVEHFVHGLSAEVAWLRISCQWCLC